MSDKKASTVSVRPPRTTQKCPLRDPASRGVAAAANASAPPKKQRAGDAVAEDRSASDSLRGYEYQIYRSVLEWLQLAQEDRLYLEHGEDILRLREGAVRHDQVKDRKALVTLGRADVLNSLGHFWSYRAKGVRATFRYITTGGVGIERRAPFGEGVCGIDVWRRAAAASAADAEADVEKLRVFLVRRDALKASVRSFLQTATAAEIHRDLIVPFDWITHEPKSDAVESQVKALLVRIARDGFGVPAIEAERLFPTFVTEVLAVAARRPNTALTRERLNEIVGQQALRLVNASQLREMVAATLGDLLQGSEPRSFAAGRPMHAPPPLPLGYVRRAHAFDEIRAALSRSAVAAVVGSAGMGKSALAKDIAAQDPSGYSWAGLRGVRAAELLARLDRIEQDVLGRPDVVRLALDDLAVGDVSAAAADAIARIVRVLRTRSGALLITTSTDPSARMLEALGISARHLVRIGAYDVDEVRTLLKTTFGEDARISEAAAVLHRITYGHPTFVAARLRRMQNVGLDVDDLLATQTPPEVQDVERETRENVSQLEPGSRDLLYRMSTAIVPVARDEALELAAKPPPIGEPGIALDRIVGPWLEVADNRGSLRRSPLVADLAAQTLGKNAATRMERDLVDVLLHRKALGADDVRGILFHALHSRHERGVGVVLASLLQQDEKTIESVARAVPFVTAWDVEAAEPPAFGRAVQLVLRAAQFRMATLTGDNDAADRVTAAFERDFPKESDAAGERFRFLGYVVAYGRGSIAQRTADALRWAEEGANVEVKLDEPAADRVASRGPGAMASALVLGRVTSYDELDSFIRVLRDAGVEAQRRFLGWLSDSPHMLRGVFGALQVVEFDRKEPRWGALAESVQRFADLASEAGLDGVAVFATSEVARLRADQLRDPDGALAVLDRADADHPGRAELLSARAFATFEKSDYEGALAIFARAVPDLPADRQDLQPSQDARIAGIAASRLGRFAEAEKWLSWASTRLSKRFFDVHRVGYAFDAAFAAWKDGRDNAVVRRLVDLLPLLQRLNDADDDLAFGMFKRIGHVLGWMTTDRSFLAAKGYHVPEIGAVSGHGVVPRDAIPPTPLGYLVEAACEFEFRAQLGSELYDAYLAGPSAANPLRPGADKVRIGWALRRRQYDDFAERLIATTVGMKTGSAQFGEPPSLSGFVEDVALLGLIAALADGTPDQTPVSWAGALGKAGYPDVQALLLRAVEIRDSTGSLSLRLLEGIDEVVTATAHQTRTLAAIVHGTSGEADPGLLAVCLHYWIHATSRAAVGIGTGETLLKTFEHVLRRSLLSGRRFAIDQEQIPILEAILDEPGRPWKKLQSIAIALGVATDRHVPGEIDAFLQGRTEEERRWFEER